MSPDESELEASRKVTQASADLDRLIALPTLEELHAMTETELRELKRSRYLAQQELKRSDREGYLALREEQLMIQSVMGEKQATRVAGYKFKSVAMPGAISAQIDAVASEAWAGAETPQ